MEAVIYTRVSKLVGARSTGEQEKECRIWCERQGYPVRAVFCDDNISASRFSTRDRPQWKEVKKALRTGDILVVWEASRAHRDLEEWVALRGLCAELSVPLSYAGRVLDLTLGDDRFTGGLDALLAERESEQTRVRTLRGKRTSAAAGEWSGGKVPWGYRLVDGEIVPDPVEAPRVREAVTRILAGDSQYSVYKWLLGDPNAYTPSNPTNLRRALEKPTYAGLRVHQGEITGKASWEPLITEEQHRRLTLKMKRQKEELGWRYRPGRPEPKYLLSGIAVCGRCGKPLRHSVPTAGTARYQCFNGHVVRSAEPIERAVVTALLERLAKVDPRDYDTEDPRVAAAQAEIEEIEAELEEWMQAAMRREVTTAAFARIEKSLRERVAALRPQAVDAKFAPVDIKKLAENWARTPLAKQKEIIRAFFRVTVVPSTDPGRRNGSVLIEPL